MLALKRAKVDNPVVLTGRPHMSNHGVNYFELAVGIAREKGDRVMEGRALCGLGNAHLDEGSPGFAIECHTEALAIARELGDRKAEGNALDGLGNGYLDLGEAAKGVAYHEEALAVARAAGDTSGVARSLCNVGNAHSELENPAAAIAFYQQALETVVALGERRTEATVLYDIADELAKLGRFHDAAERGRAALHIFEELEAPEARIVRAALVAWSSAVEDVDP